VLTFESGRDPLSPKGSYPDAMGYCQFMPSSYDDDSVADIWTSPDDAIASVANYFLQHGWQPDGTVAVPANDIGASPDLFEGGLKPSYSVGDLAEEGFAPSVATDITLKATPLRLQACFKVSLALSIGFASRTFMSSRVTTTVLCMR
jgi:membrane-bound lytic murein transglycosylase B